MATLNYISSTSSTITVKLEGLDQFAGTRTYQWSTDGILWTGVEREAGSQTAKTHKFTGLTAGTVYTLRCRMTRSDRPDVQYNYNVQGITGSGSATMTVTARTQTSITIRLRYYDKTSDTRTFKFYANDVLMKHENWQGSSQTVQTTITGLTPGTTYTIKSVSWREGETTAFTKTVTATTLYPTTDTGSLRIYFNSNGTSGDVVLTTAARGYARTAKITTGSTTKTITIPAGSTSVRATAFSFPTELTNYTISGTITNPDKVTTWSGYITANNGLNKTLSISVKESTEDSVTVSAKIGAASTSYPRKYTFKCGGKTLTGTGTSGTVTSAKTVECTVTGLMPGKSYEFSIDVTAQNVSPTATSPNYSAKVSGSTLPAVASFSISSKTEYSATAKLSKLTANLSIDRKVKWYYKLGSASTYTYFAESSISKSTTEVSKTIDVLASNTAYTIKAELYSGTTLLLTKTATVTTEPTPAAIGIGSTSTSSVKVIVNSLEPTSYDRTFAWYYKRSEESSYTLYDSTVYEAGNLSGTISEKVQGLLSNTQYDFKVYIKKGSLTLKTLTKSAKTDEDVSGYPHPDIDHISSRTGTKAISVTFSAPDHQLNAKYAVEYSTDGSTWTTLINNLTKPGTYNGTLPNFDTTYQIRVKAWMVSPDASNKSAAESVYVYSEFAWDTTKSAGGTFILTAVEWQRFVKLILEKYDAVYDTRSIAAETLQSLIGTSIPGYPLTAGAVNIAVAVLDELGAYEENTAPEDVIPTEPVKASYLNALKDAINRV